MLPNPRSLKVTRLLPPFPRELRDLFFSILFVWRPDALQLIFVNHTVADVDSLRFQLALDLPSKSFHSN
jgi:hypothetical protein